MKMAFVAFCHKTLQIKRIALILLFTGMAETLIDRLSQQDVNIGHVAREFVRQFSADRSQLYFELADIICHLCEVPSFPQRTMKDGNVAAMENFLKRLRDPSTETIRNCMKELHSMEYWPNVMPFFNHVINDEWNLLSRATKFESIFIKFLRALTDAKLPTLRHLGLAIQLEFITVCSVEKTELLQNEHRLAVLKYAKSVLKRSFCDYDRQIWGYALSRMRLWFGRNALLLEDGVLKYLVDGTSDYLDSNSLQCVQISSELLDKHDDNKPLLADFISSLVRKLEPRLGTDDMKLFEMLCSLAIVLRTKYADVNKVDKFVDTVLQYTFAVDEPAKARIAANVFRRVELQNLSAFEQLRRIVQFLAPRNSVYVECFVATVMEDYEELLTNWVGLADALKRLTEMSEKEMLLLVILFVVHYKLKSEVPSIRGEDANGQAADDLKAVITKVFAPFLLSCCRENVSPRWRLMVAKLALYFDCDCLEPEHTTAVSYLFFATCVEEQSRVVLDKATMSVTFRLMVMVLEHGRHADQLIGIAGTVRKHIFVLERELRQYAPDYFVRCMNRVITISVYHSISPLEDEKCTYAIPVKLLQMELNSVDEILRSACHELAIKLSSDYVSTLLLELDSSASDGADIAARLERVQVVFSLVSDYLNRQFHSRIGELSFLALCMMVKALFSANVSESQRRTLFTDAISQSLVMYVKMALGNVQVTQVAVPEVGAETLKFMIAQFSDLILSDVLPLVNAYELLHAHCWNTSKVEDQLIEFLIKLLDCRFAHEVAQWILNFFAEYFKVVDHDSLVRLTTRARRLGQLLLPIRDSVQDVMKKFHKLGVDLALSLSVTRGGLSSVTFLLVLVEFSPCLLSEARKSCFEYLKPKRIRRDDLDAAKPYFNSLR